MKKLAAPIALALASIALVACGSSNNPTTTTSGEEATGGAAQEAEAGGGGGSTVSLEADPGGQITYTNKTATAKAGKVTIEFKNPQPLSHDVAIEAPGGERIGKTSLIAESQTSMSVNLKPGTYHYFCTVPGHRQAGMEGKLTVK